jgi:hypothetical protein
MSLSTIKYKIIVNNTHIEIISVVFGYMYFVLNMYIKGWKVIRKKFPDEMEFRKIGPSFPTCGISRLFRGLIDVNSWLIGSIRLCVRLSASAFITSVSKGSFCPWWFPPGNQSSARRWFFLDNWLRSVCLVARGIGWRLLCGKNKVRLVKPRFRSNDQTKVVFER